MQQCTTYLFGRQRGGNFVPASDLLPVARCGICSQSLVIVWSNKRHAPLETATAARSFGSKHVKQIRYSCTFREPAAYFEYWRVATCASEHPTAIKHHPRLSQTIPLDSVFTCEVFHYARSCESFLKRHLKRLVGNTKILHLATPSDWSIAGPLLASL